MEKHKENGIFILNDNEKTIYQNMWDVAKSLLRGTL